jgi:hypothetical protein
MRGRLLQEDHIEAISIVLAKLAQKDREAVGIQARQLPPEGIACGRLHGGIEPVILVQRRDDLDGLHAEARESPPERQMQAETAFILAEDPHGLSRRLAPEGRQRAEAAGAVLNKVSRFRGIFLAWRGRGRFSLALSW